MEHYPIKSSQPYGPTWGKRRPPGLPVDARRTSTKEAGMAFLKQRLDALGVHGVLRTALIKMALKESGAQLGRPTGTFDARIKAHGQDGAPHYYGTAVDGLRDKGKPIVTAYGMFQFNRGAWRGLKGVKRDEFPWDCTAEEEVDRPLMRYMEMWDEAKGCGANDVAAARYVHLWQRGPSRSGSYLDGAVEHGGDADAWTIAWDNVPRSHRNRVDHHLREAGIIR